MPIYEVQTPDGKMLEFEGPAGASQAELLAYAKANAPKQEKSLGATILDKAKLYTSAALRGPAAVMQGMQWLGKQRPPDMPRPGMAHLSGPAPKDVDYMGAASLGVKPETTADKYITSGIEGISSSLLFPGAAAAPALSAVAGGASGLAGELGDQLSGGNPAVRLLAGLAGGMGAGAAASRIQLGRPQARELAKQGLEGISEAEQKAAQDFMRYAAAQGMNIDAAQALAATRGGAGAGNLQILRDMLAQAKGGDQIQANLRAQPAGLQLAVGQELDTLPGVNVGPSAAANDLQRYATDAINAVRAVRSKNFEDDLVRLGGIDKNVDPNDAKAVLAMLKAEADAKGGTNIAKWLEDLRSRLLQNPAQAAGPLTPIGAGKVTGKLQVPSTPAVEEVPRLNVRQINEVLKERANILKLGGPDIKDSGFDIGTSKWLSSLIDKAREGYGANFEPIRVANQNYRAFTERTLNPLKQGPVGSVAGRGYSDELQAKLNNFDTILNKGTSLTATTSEIRTLGKQLSTVDGGLEAFENALQTSLRSRLENAFKISPGTTTAENLDAGQKALNAVFGAAPQTRGIRDALSISAEQRLGKAAVPEVLAGLDNVQRLLKAAANSVTPMGMSKDEVIRMASGSRTADTIRIFGFLPFERAARRLEDSTMQKTFQQFDKLLTTPEGLDTLRKLAKTPVMSPAAITLLASFTGSVGQASRDTEPAPVNAQ